MTGAAISDILDLTARIMELHDENPFKIKALSNAAFKLSKNRSELDSHSLEKISSMEGIGKGITAKIIEILETGTTSELEGLLEKTPKGLVELMEVKGLGPKKVKLLWQELGIETVGELLYACHENRLTDLKGFGPKTQEAIRQNIEFKLQTAHFFHYAAIEPYAEKLINFLQLNNNGCRIAITGDYRRKCEVIDKLLLVADQEKIAAFEEAEKLCPVPIELICCKKKDFEKTVFESTGSKQFLEISGYTTLTGKTFETEMEIFNALQLSWMEPELREENRIVMHRAKMNKIPPLIQLSDIKGVLHNHTTYSDGIHSLREMAEHCSHSGFHYLGICDHSVSATYANGLKKETIIEQQKEIDLLNKELFPFRIFKGIESDILGNGALDYDNETLSAFDFVVASIHSNLKMNEEKANQRLINAIENPYTTILGHPTGRLLLARNGYPMNHKKIIDACAANKVIIELNAHPYRLDIDWRWIPYCIEKGVLISINPDAHQKEGFKDIQYGINVARKGMLSKENCFNALSLNEIENYFTQKKNKISNR